MLESGAKTLEAVHKQLASCRTKYLLALEGLEMPAEAKRRSLVSDANYLWRLISKPYIEDFHTTTITYFLEYRVPESDERPFLRAFLDVIARRRPSVKSLTPAANRLRLQREAASDGWIDIRIFDEKSKTVIIVENKIWAIDQYQQLPRYYHDQTEKGYRVPAVVYLSLTGKRPSQDDWTDEEVTSIPLVALPLWDSERDSLLSEWHSYSQTDPRLGRVGWLLEQYIEIVKERREVAEMTAIVRDFARDLSNNPTALKSISDVMNNQEPIQNALCIELADRLEAALRKDVRHQIDTEHRNGDKAVMIDCSKTFYYVLWVDGGQFSHGVEPKQKKFTKRQADQFKQLGLVHEQDGTHFKVVRLLTLDQPDLHELFSDDSVSKIVSEVKSNIDKVIALIEPAT